MIKGSVCFLCHFSTARKQKRDAPRFTDYGGCDCRMTPLFCSFLISLHRSDLRLERDTFSAQNLSIPYIITFNNGYLLFQALLVWTLATILHMSYYAQPAAANYNSAPLHNQRQRGYRICDQCGTAETPAVKFRLCGGCVRSLNVLHTDIVFNKDPFIMIR